MDARSTAAYLFWFLCDQLFGRHGDGLLTPAQDLWDQKRVRVAIVSLNPRNMVLEARGQMTDGTTLTGLAALKNPPGEVD